MTDAIRYPCKSLAELKYLLKYFLPHVYTNLKRENYSSACKTEYSITSILLWSTTIKGTTYWSDIHHNIIPNFMANNAPQYLSTYVIHKRINNKTICLYKFDKMIRGISDLDMRDTVEIAKLFTESTKERGCLEIWNTRDSKKYAKLIMPKALPYCTFCDKYYNTTRESVLCNCSILKRYEQC